MEVFLCAKSEIPLDVAGEVLDIDERKREREREREREKKTIFPSRHIEAFAKVSLSLFLF
jgi:hypothetical protein